MRKYLPFLFLLLSIQILPQEVNPKFQLALSKYGSEQYEDALKLFGEVYSSTSSYSSAALLFKGKTELKLDRLEQARKTITGFLTVYPATALRDEARITLAKIFVELGDGQSALREILYLIEDTRSEEYLSYAKETGEKIAASLLTSDDLEKMLPLASGKKAKPFLLLLTGKSYLKINNKLDADAAFLEILELYPESPEEEEASVLYRQELKEKQEIYDNQVPVIAALLPLTKSGTDEESASAKEILEGIKFAVSEYNDQKVNKVGLLILNTEGSPARIDDLQKELDRIPSLKVIIGPIFSDEVRAALRVFKNKNIPIISPTATDNDLTELNDLFFQANPNFNIRGKGMAQYVFYVEKKRKIAVLNAVEGYSPDEALGFTSEFERLGGEIIARETYNSGSFELQAQARILSGYPELEGIFIPLADKADASVIINELMMNNISVPIYGNQDWFNSKINSNLSGLSGQLIFTSDHFIDYNNIAYQEFSIKFNSVASIDVSRNVFYGYDAAKFILASVSNWDISPLEISKRFKRGIEVEGYHNNICFDGQRVNNFLNIIRFRDGSFELEEKYKISVR